MANKEQIEYKGYKYNGHIIFKVDVENWKSIIDAMELERESNLTQHIIRRSRIQ